MSRLVVPSLNTWSVPLDCPTLANAQRNLRELFQLLQGLSRQAASPRVSARIASSFVYSFFARGHRPSSCTTSCATSWGRPS